MTRALYIFAGSLMVLLTIGYLSWVSQFGPTWPHVVFWTSAFGYLWWSFLYWRAYVDFYQRRSFE